MKNGRKSSPLFLLLSQLLAKAGGELVGAVIIVIFF